MVETLFPGIVCEGCASFPYGSGANETLQSFTVAFSRLVGNFSQVRKGSVGETDVTAALWFTVDICHKSEEASDDKTEAEGDEGDNVVVHRGVATEHTLHTFFGSATPSQLSLMRLTVNA